jgi:LmbE family N-acetylglucosaminyl deacetylase
MPQRTVLAVSPHPDDELLGAPALLMALRDAGWRVVNLVCSLGREGDRERRRREVTAACQAAGFQLVVPNEPPPISSDADLAAAQPVLAGLIAGVIDSSGADIVVGPSPHDGHHGHEVVGRAVRDALEAGVAQMAVAFWAVWGDLPLPNLIVRFSGERLSEIQGALRSHAGELARNRLDLLVESRAVASAVLGPERVFGFGIAGGPHRYAELLMHVIWSRKAGWRLAAPREFDPQDPVASDDGLGPDVGWWLHEASLRNRVASRK